MMWDTHRRRYWDLGEPEPPTGIAAVIAALFGLVGVRRRATRA